MVHPCCGMSLQKATRNIAIIDIVICVISATIRLILFDFQEYSEFYDSPKFETSDTSQPFHINVSLGINQIEELHGSLGKEMPMGKDTQYKKEKLVVTEFVVTTPKPLGKNSTAKSVLIAHTLKQDSLLAGFVGMAIIGLVIFSCYIVLEIWLCRILLAASSNRDSFNCIRWFWVRLTLTIISLVFSLFGMVTLRYAWVEWALEPMTFYRVYELYVVTQFNKEIIATSGIIRHRA